MGEREGTTPECRTKGCPQLGILRWRDGRLYCAGCYGWLSLFAVLADGG